jgi:hypothetical protein
VRLARRGGDLPVVPISARDGATTGPLLEAVEAALASAGFADVAPPADPDSASLSS